MKLFLLFLSLTLFISACNQKENDTQQLQSQIDSLQNQLANSYKPGLGEFMSSIQIHHEKLWFAGIHKNWQLADFEINEIKEAIDDIQNYCSDRPERLSLAMINAPLDTINSSIQQQNLVAFKSSFITLTNTCNNCHKSTQHAFNVIKIPDSTPFSNQVFSPADVK